MCLSFFVFTATAPTETYTLSLHDALPICHASRRFGELSRRIRWHRLSGDRAHAAVPPEVPTVVVRLEPGADAVQYPRVSVSRAARRRISIHGRGRKRAYRDSVPLRHP